MGFFSTWIPGSHTTAEDVEADHQQALEAAMPEIKEAYLEFAKNSADCINQLEENVNNLNNAIIEWNGATSDPDLKWETALNNSGAPTAEARENCELSRLC